LVLVVAVVAAPMTLAKIWTTVYRCDETTPLVPVDPNRPTIYRDIMVGTRLVILVSSDQGGYWWGSLQSSWEGAPYAALTGRGYLATLPGTSVKMPNYKDSLLPSAGKEARARPYAGSFGIGLELYSDVRAVPGDWFIFDYQATQAGSCDLRLYNLSASYDVPLETLSFTHIRSRDFNGDTVVDFQDFALLASRCSAAVEPDPNGPDAAFDLDANGRIDLGDIASFSEYWLQRTDCGKPVTDPNKPSPGP
jgi:hypothetical protein